MSPTTPRQPGAGGARQQATPAFKVHRDSHLIHKGAAGASLSSPPSSSSTNSSVSSSPGATVATNSNGGGAGQRPALRPKQQQQPVIIYTHSPKVIRTSPRDFMSIVQKLTGLESAASSVTAAAQDESSSSSTESCANAKAHAAAPPGHYMDPQMMPPPVDAHFIQDIPLFAPGASEQQLLCASRGLYGQFPPMTVDAAALGPVNMHSAAAGGAVFFPSMVEANDVSGLPVIACMDRSS